MSRGLLVLLILAALVAVQLFRPVPYVSAATALPTTFRVPGSAPNIPWPSAGEAALAVQGVGLIGQSGSQTPRPIASLAKIMTAFLVLQKHPLSPGQNGPSITITAADVARYQQDYNGGQSVSLVAAGEVLTERQALEALLLPSANNIAWVLSRWIAGSQSAFVQEMNAEARKLGMKHTHYTDASGVRASTVSTARDQLTIAEAAMAIPTFRHIVSMPQATIPVAGTVYNVNYFLGKSGIIGVKTGSTGHAGGCYVFAAYRTVGNQKVLVIGSVLGQGGVQPLFTALRAGRALLNAAGSLLTTDRVLVKGQPAATIRAAWTGPMTVTTSKTVTFIGWPGMTGHIHFVAQPMGHAVKAGNTVGELIVTLGQQQSQDQLRAPKTLAPPSAKWRLTRL